eukprot:3226798-Amphidinium_carterae.1
MTSSIDEVATVLETSTVNAATVDCLVGEKAVSGSKVVFTTPLNCISLWKCPVHGVHWLPFHQQSPP